MTITQIIFLFVAVVTIDRISKFVGKKIKERKEKKELEENPEQENNSNNTSANNIN